MANGDLILSIDSTVVHPGTDNQSDLGENALRFKDLYLSGKIYGGHINVTTVTDTYVILVTDDVVLCNKSSAFTVTLPVASGSGKVYYIKNINTGVVTIEGNSSDTIDGALNFSLDTQYDAISIVDGAANKWYITGFFPGATTFGG